MTERIHFLNGKLVTEAELLISPRDLGFLRGYAVFDFLKTYNRKPFKLPEHIDRLFNSAKLIGLHTPWSKEQVISWVSETLQANKDTEEKFIKIVISGGVSDSLMPPENPTIMIWIDKCGTHDPNWYANGINVSLVKFERYTPEAKTNNYIEGVKQVQLGKPTGALEPIYYSDKQVFEACSSNVFAVINGKLVTTENNILKGITRGVLLDILKLNIPIEVRDFTKEELLNATEVFLSASGKEILPVTKIDGKDVGDGKVGEVTKVVMRQFEEYTTS